MDEARVKGLEEQKASLLARIAHIDAELAKELGTAETATIRPTERATKPRASRKAIEQRSD